MSLSTPIFGSGKPKTQSGRLVRPVAELTSKSGDVRSDALGADPASGPEPGKLAEAKSKVSLRADGWWVVDLQGADVAGPFKTLSEVEDHLDWKSNQ
jgi:hypothetical protein